MVPQKKQGLTIKSVIVVGAGVAGRQIAAAIRRNPHLNLRVSGFIDDVDHPQAKRYAPYLGPIRALEQIVKKYHPSEVLIAIPSGSGELVRDIVRRGAKAKVKCRIIPGTAEVIGGTASIAQLRPVLPEDMVGRPIVRKNLATIARRIANQRVLVTGAAGSIGSELCRQILPLNPQSLIALDWSENGMHALIRECGRYNNFTPLLGDYTDNATLNGAFAKYRPSIVFHTAAFKHVDLMEKFPELAIRYNVLGTYNLAQHARKAGAAHFVQISTDKAADPHGIMGISKLLGEHLVSALTPSKQFPTRFVITRFGNVLGSNGSILPLFSAQIQQGGPVTITDPSMSRYFMTIHEAVNLVLLAYAQGEHGDLFVLKMGEPINLGEFAESVIRLAGFEPYSEIPITVIGRRPGEKQHEILLSADELARAAQTQHFWRIAHAHTRPFSTLKRIITKLEHTLKTKPHQSATALRTAVRILQKEIL